MQKPVKKVVVTGAGGQIAYSLIFRIAAGDLLGPDQPIILHLLEIPELEASLKGVAMELDDCVFPLLKGVKVGSDPNLLFEGVDYALLVGSKPRGPGMERKDLLGENGKIFVGQGKALNDHASKDVLVFVVGNPCNTNCLIAMHHAPNIPRKNFFAMTRLDQNRATFQLAKKAGVDISEVTNVTIWGNHSSTQVPDFLNARIRGKKAVDVITDRNWLEKEFVSKIQKRGAEVINARGKSSAASAAHGIIGSIQALITPTLKDNWFSVALQATNNPYGINNDLVFSFPCRTDGKHVSIVPNVSMDPFLQEMIKLTEKELTEERDLVLHLLKG